MKYDLDYQTHGAYEKFHFPAGSSWFVATDQRVYAALSGQYLLEQIFYLPIAAMQEARWAL